MSDLAGAAYGIEPLLDHTEVLQPIDSRDILTNPNDYRDGSEFGGVSGRVQPTPHVPTGIERLHQVYAIDPTDDGSRADSVQAPELEGEFPMHSANS